VAAFHPLAGQPERPSVDRAHRNTDVQALARRERHASGPALHGGDEVDRDGHVDVGTALARLAGARAAYVAEQLAENVAGIEAAPRTARLRPRSRAALGVGTPKAGLRSFGARCVDLSPIEAGPLGSVREEVI